MDAIDARTDRERWGCECVSYAERPWASHKQDCDDPWHSHSLIIQPVPGLCYMARRRERRRTRHAI